MPRQALEHPLVDFVVEGEGEETFADLVQALEAGDSVADIPGVWSKTGSGVH